MLLLEKPQICVCVWGGDLTHRDPTPVLKARPGSHLISVDRKACTEVSDELLPGETREAFLIPKGHTAK